MTFVFFNDPATTEIYTLSLHDALPILLALLTLPIIVLLHLLRERRRRVSVPSLMHWQHLPRRPEGERIRRLPLTLRSEEHTSELQSRQYLVCRLLLEKKKINLLAPQRR